jgi:hypothetical protein
MAAKKERPAPAKAPRNVKKLKAQDTATSETPVAAHARAEISKDELRQLVSEAAYYRAKQRGFTPGHEVEDWVQAEAEVLRRIGADGTARRQSRN